MRLVKEISHPGPIRFQLFMFSIYAYGNTKTHFIVQVLLSDIRSIYERILRRWRKFIPRLMDFHIFSRRLNKKSWFLECRLFIRIVERGPSRRSNVLPDFIHISFFYNSFILDQCTLDTNVLLLRKAILKWMLKNKMAIFSKTPPMNFI